ncbi:WavQ [Vibrio coralliilyticus]|uniref:WavQ n=1 Tax=Vibrio coralliilyticus TaxID=190893 RepID=UPI00148D2E7A|nr:WavQ [Vibrio coralliilyticus]NOI30732.1 WavQ [Vibrio coralliilyticus]NOI49721.1 WavQ [Vibrio coralliilyticus]WFB48047.1 WavQ [Vibrio coralliilyticus]
MKVLIYTSEYDSKNGGVVVLHRLAHLINSETDHQAYLVPRSYDLSVQRNSLLSRMRKKLRHIRKVRCYQTNTSWQTPLLPSPTKNEINDSIVVYPEIINGNPLQAGQVVRWLLHQPGHFSGKVEYGKRELIYKFNSAIKDFEWPGSKTSENELKVIYYPVDLYNTHGSVDEDERTVTCHAIRKGKHKPKVHPEDSILIDSLSHEEVAKVFKKAKRFISYDDYTAYSIFATLCGCQSIVVPDTGVSIEQWYPKESDRYGIAYGFDDKQIEWCKNTKHLVEEHIEREHSRSIECVKTFLSEAEDYFSTL